MSLTAHFFVLAPTRRATSTGSRAGAAGNASAIEGEAGIESNAIVSSC